MAAIHATTFPHFAGRALPFAHLGEEPSRRGPEPGNPHAADRRERADPTPGDQRPARRATAGAPPPPTRPPQPPNRQASDSSQTASSFSYQRSARTTLVLTTQEGDTVQIKLRAHSGAELAAAEFASGDTLLSAFDLQTRNTSRMSLLVNGNLNAAELSAIRSVVAQVGAIAQDFFAGDVAAAFASAQHFEMDGTQLARVGIAMHAEEAWTYSARQASSGLAPRAAPPLAVAAPDPPRAEVLPGDRTTSVTPLAAASGRGEPLGRGQPITDALAQIDRFLKGLLDQLAQPTPSEKAAGRPTLDLAVKIKLLASMLTEATTLPTTNTAPSDPTGPPLPALVTQTLEALAAQHQPPLHTEV